MPEVFDFVLGMVFLVSGIIILLFLPRYQRRVESGEIRRDELRPSFTTLRRAAVGFVVVGILILIGWSFHLF